jgi:hypothetical protein
MRLALCLYCKTLSKIEDRHSEDPGYDPLLQDWIDRHAHGLNLDVEPGSTYDAHPGGRLYQLDTGNVTGANDEALSAIERRMVEEVRAEVAKANQEVYDLRDEVREDAVKCHLLHGQPSYPGSPCSDYQHSSKLIGRRNTPERFRQYTCTYCPYESTVTVAKRALRGDYK